MVAAKKPAPTSKKSKPVTKPKILVIDDKKVGVLGVKDNFLGLEPESSTYEKSKVVIISAPYEKTVELWRWYRQSSQRRSSMLRIMSNSSMTNSNGSFVLKQA